MSLFLDQHPEIKKIHRLNETPGWITEAFILHKNFSFIESNEELLKQENWANCETAVVLAEPVLEAHKALTDKLFLIGRRLSGAVAV